MERKTRTETNLRKTNSKDGSFSPHIGKRVTDKIKLFAELKNINKTKLVEELVENSLDSLFLTEIEINDFAKVIKETKDKSTKELATDIMVEKMMSN